MILRRIIRYRPMEGGAVRTPIGNVVTRAHIIIIILYHNCNNNIIFLIITGGGINITVARRMRTHTLASIIAKGNKK